MNAVVKKDPRVIAALKRHGVTDFSGVRCEPIPITWMIFPEQTNGRIGFGDCNDSHGVYHPWGRAIEGVYILADLTSEKVLRVTRALRPEIFATCKTGYCRGSRTRRKAAPFSRGVFRSL